MENELSSVHEGQFLCDSRDIAKKLKRQHKYILCKIDKLSFELEKVEDECVRIKFPPVFEEKTYLVRGQSYRYVQMNKPAYSLFVMGLSGKRAFKVQLLFNDAFYQWNTLYCSKATLSGKAHVNRANRSE